MLMMKMNLAALKVGLSGIIFQFLLVSFYRNITEPSTSRFFAKVGFARPNISKIKKK